MPLDELVGVIETLKERIAAHGASLRENETRTRMALIDPLLQALGWDISDPAMVTPEYSVGASRADYALLTPTGNPSALVEAKKLDESLASHRMQMLNYANISGIPHAGLTDGNHWEMYTVFDQAPIEQRRILDVSMANTPAHEAALKLLLLWQPNLASGQPVAASSPFLPSFSDDQPLSSVTEFKPKPQPSVADANSIGSKWSPISQVAPSIGDQPPIAIRMNQGVRIDINRWNQVLISVAEWLSAQGKMSERDCPITVGTARNLIAVTPVHRSGREFSSPRRISNGLYLELDFTGKDFLRHTRTLLGKVGVSGDSVELLFR